MKYFRKQFGPKIRFFMCGEYGDALRRPHYHACIFNFDFTDKIHYTTRNGVKLYVSPSLQKLWPKGFSTIGDVTFESAAYVARYITKKITGDLAHTHYDTLDTSTGEHTSLTPEFQLMSRRPGIAHAWYQQFKTDLDKDFITLNGAIMRPAKYYDYLLNKEILGEPELQARKLERKKNALKQSHDNTQKRLDVKETIKHKRIQLLHRSLEK